MKLLIWILAMLGPVGFLMGGEQYILKDASPWEESLASHSFERVNMYSLFEQARKRLPAANEDDLPPRVKMNINYIFHNRLNRGRFLVAPSPESIVERISTILELSDELDQLLKNGRRLAAQGESVRKYGEVFERINDTSQELRHSFEEFFVEGGNSNYVLEYPTVAPISAQFVHFILQSERINQDLDERLDEFFFGSSPGAISLTEYEKSSILVLSQSLSRLSRIAEKRFADALK